jgi:hypothetical protein
MAVLPILGALAGGIEGYRRSGGDIGATALGAGLGAVTPAGLRMAGTALGGTTLGARLLGGIPEAVSRAGGALGATKVGQAALKAGMIPQGPLPAMTAAGLGGLAAGVGTALGAPALAGALASKASAPIRGAAQVGAGTLGYQAPGEIDYAALGGGGGAVPPVGTFGAGGTLSDPLNVLGRVGMAQRLETSKTAEAQRDALRMLLPEISKAAEFRSKAEMQRQLAAAGVRQNIITAANMLERSQQAAQQMGLNAASQAGSALTQQYQYQ